MIKQTMQIETMLQWTYRQELPRRALTVGQWDSVRSYGERGFVASDGPGAPQRYASVKPPHADALRIEQAVEGLAEDIELDWLTFRDSFMSDLAAIVPADPFVIAVDAPLAVQVSAGRAQVQGSQRVRRRVFSKAALVAEHAKMGTHPRWRLGLPRLNRVLSNNGRGMIVGKYRDKGAYNEGSHCPVSWSDPTVAQVALARATYAVWREGLSDLAQSLRGQLATIEPAVPVVPLMPWHSGDLPGVRILRSVTPPRPANDGAVVKGKRAG